MLTGLSIRNVVLIEALDLVFPGGLGVLTGETGAGKSILLDSLGLVLGDRADSGLVRAGEDVASVTATFEFARRPDGVEAILTEAAIDWEPGEPLLVRRRLRADGGSRAYINDQPVGVALLRELARFLVELHGQHDDRGLVNARGHRALLDRYARADAAEVARAWDSWRAAEQALAQARARVASAAAEQDLIEAHLAELDALKPVAGEEEELALQRAEMQKGERLSGDLNELQHLWSGSDAPLVQLRGAARRLDRIAAEHPLLAEALEALDRAVIEAGEAEDKLSAAAEALAHDPALLDRIETRLFDLRAAARKHGCTVDDLPARREALQAALQSIEGGEAQIAGLARVAMDAGLDYRAKAEALSVQRAEAARKLDKAVAAELAPLRLDAARFHTAVVRLPEDRWSGQGMDAVEFLISTNPGSDFAPLGKIASGGELSRFILALKVALAEQGGAATVIFDEIDRGVGGAVASAIGERLARLAHGGQLLAVTHSPQVAARGDAHYLIAKSSEGTVTRTSVSKLDAAGRQEEIARMLSGAEVTAEARAQASRLLEQA
ncbi:MULTISPECIES: DNA repair protein RecN [unclassified Novosphingobium]|uniref:DNA repair protein RecN n=1 Tax=unclassified Novosphingobium TaxID=2644732 RepID=UPI00149455C0|nr:MULTISPECIES: DNA repair protein RecN [unclassified Novosphingobium]MBB3357794.1 DNA repair protein RecN (Recombination protein N) [Novosphingobium sp. BK256]MBB3373542.1 DNA repair protein RecN (Recombination protein N) [Novosphingobium sp. BK280]MBB3377954.1 DNA repair protein RecN (Recombination protein N) [Novosphingobium sp. BK258]MBB3420261.1 DNA repair protein RecN (Recombination protein N) [Novosphingobium sp. BK267]MBB3447417.1 DNA repair protein RecN (Recombination protein N) [Nov